MKRLWLFLYYCYALQAPVHDVYIFDIRLAWELAGIASKPL